MTTAHCLATLCLAIASISAGSPVLAGMDKESTSEVPGLFFAWLPQKDGGPDRITVYFSDSTLHDRFIKHCASGQPVYQYRSNTRYTCKADWYNAAAPSPPAVALSMAGVTVQGPLGPADGSFHYGVFSLSPTPTTRWHQRTATADEQTALQTAIRRQKTRLASPLVRRATVVTASKGQRRAYLVPGAVVRDEETDYYAQRYHVFVQQAGRLHYRGMLPAKPKQFLDVDGDDLPEILVSEQCDGWCESLWSVDRQARQIARFWGH